MSLLDICQAAASQLGLRQPDAIVGSTGQTEQLLLRHANAAAKHLVKYHDWQDLIVSQSFTTVATAAQTGALPDDYQRMVYNVEVWDTTNNLRYVGPTNQRRWRLLNSAVSGGVSGWWRLLRGELNLYPTPSAGNTLVFEYITKNIIEDAGGDGQSEFMADTDVVLLDEELFVLEIIWRFRHGRGFSQYAEDMKTADIEKEKAASQDRGTGRIRPEADGVPDPVWDGTVTEA